LNQWKETKSTRKAKKELRKKEYLLKHSSSKELLDVIKVKELEAYLEVVEKSDIKKEEN
jgi:hypothetical protein